MRENSTSFYDLQESAQRGFALVDDAVSICIMHLEFGLLWIILKSLFCGGTITRNVWKNDRTVERWTYFGWVMALMRLCIEGASTKDDEQFNLHSVKNQWFGNQLPLLWWFLKRQQHFEANYALHSNNFEEVNFNVEDAAKAREEGLPSLSRSSRILVNQTFKSRAKRQ